MRSLTSFRFASSDQADDTPGPSLPAAPASPRGSVAGPRGGLPRTRPTRRRPHDRRAERLQLEPGRPPGHCPPPSTPARAASRAASTLSPGRRYLLRLRVQRRQLQAGAAPRVHEVTARQLEVQFRQILDTNLNVFPKEKNKNNAILTELKISVKYILATLRRRSLGK